MFYLAWLIPIAPLIATVVGAVIAFLQPKNKLAHWPTWIGLGVSAIASIACLTVIDVAGTGLNVGGYNWLDIGGMQLAMSLQLDAVSLVEISVVTFVATLVSIYSAGYMKGDGGYARFFAVFSGFVFCMTMLVTASNLLVLYMFWEGVGLCSYLMIGFWYKRPAAAKAATKAFLVNRLADSGFAVGIFLLWVGVGQVSDPSAGAIARLDYGNIFEVLPKLAELNPGLVTLVAILLLVGACGKSAQFPLHVWLPDAMEGPTPVSALIHAATMVTAGVYLLCRMSPLLVLVPSVLVLAGWIGAITALLAASIALFQDDLKRVLAYSTVSQLGYMFMAISCGATNDLMALAVTAALFHVATHAFFKALLFLSAGNVMHAMGDVIDMRQFSGLKSVLPKTNLLFLIGGAALAGLPLLSGFWSKDGILGLLVDAQHDEVNAFSFQIFLVVGLFTAFLTAVYTSRAYYRTFLGPLRMPKDAHPHEAPRTMNAPLIVLSVGALLFGLALGPTGVLSSYMHQLPGLPEAAHGEHHWWVVIASTVIAIGGVATGYLSAQKAWTFRAAGSVGKGLSAAGKSRFYLDELYSGLVVKPLEWFASALAKIDIDGIDGLWRFVAEVPKRLGAIVSCLQCGQVGVYSAAMAVGFVAYLLIITFA